jgi:hypothetical protein
MIALCRLLWLFRCGLLFARTNFAADAAEGARLSPCPLSWTMAFLLGELVAEVLLRFNPAGLLFAGVGVLLLSPCWSCRLTSFVGVDIRLCAALGVMSVGPLRGVLLLLGLRECEGV